VRLIVLSSACPKYYPVIACLSSYLDSYGCPESPREIGGLGITVLLVEQEVNTVFKMASRNYFLSSCKIIAQGQGHDLLQNEVMRKTYLGL